MTRVLKASHFKFAITLQKAGSGQQSSFDRSLASPQPWASPARLWCLQMLGCSGPRLCLQNPYCPQAAGVGTPRRERGQMCWLAGRVPRSVSESGRPSGKSLNPVGQHLLCNKTKVCFQSPLLSLAEWLGSWWGEGMCQERGCPTAAPQGLGSFRGAGRAAPQGQGCWDQPSGE